MTYLDVMCNYDCGAMIRVGLGERPSDGSGFTPKAVVYEWFGKAILEALVDHHADCPRYYPRALKRRPQLHVVGEGA